MPLKVTIVSFCPARNRQADDLAEAFRSRGASVGFHRAPCCVQAADGFAKIGQWILGRIPHGLGMGRSLALAWRTGLPATDVLVCVNYTSLCAALPLAIVRRPNVIYYGLETVESSIDERIEAALCRRLQATVLIPEMNRAQRIESRLEGRCVVEVIPNVPHLTRLPTRTGKLRRYLSASPDELIVLYSGSWQPYSRLEQLVAGSAEWPPKTRFAMMISGPVPTSLEIAVLASGGRAALVPGVPPRELYGWIADADIGLLPYEDDADFKVRYCAPQKLFDYLACAIPFVASRRPLIEAVVSEAQCGLCVDMTSPAAVAAAVRALQLPPVRTGMAARGREAHVRHYHYEHFIAPVCARFIKADVQEQAN